MNKKIDIIDKSIVYHLGTSINHAGSKTFSINILTDEFALPFNTVMHGEGTASPGILDFLGLKKTEKTIPKKEILFRWKREKRWIKNQSKNKNKEDSVILWS